MSERRQSASENEKSMLSASEQREAVRDRYSSIAETEDSGCCEPTSEDDTDSCSSGGCCDDTTLATKSERLGYTEDDIDAVASGADLGLGCGNPTALANLAQGQQVLDLGSGGGFDCFLAARKVGPTGFVIGVDMTPEMIERARKNIDKNETENVEFRLGEIEHLPVADGSIDVIISNCVINLSPNKSQVFSEAFRVLRPGGQFAISDVVMTAEVPQEFRADPESVSGCVAGAATISDLEAMLERAGFEGITIEPKEDSHQFIREWSSEHRLEDYIVSATIEGQKPNTE
ncbi:arsenite methyltransferase [Halocatena marina]|uniref:arsenite methyltransferase n=1 Tax=Halocatena marina TaxID=2934937 RepID=UPI00200F3EFD|nr:arsenite methyltransferase [Halocatena marina]